MTVLPRNIYDGKGLNFFGFEIIIFYCFEIFFIFEVKYYITVFSFLDLYFRIKQWVLVVGNMKIFLCIKTKGLIRILDIEVKILSRSLLQINNI